MKKKLLTLFLTTLLVFGLFSCLYHKGYCAKAPNEIKKERNVTKAKTNQTTPQNVINTTSLNIVNNPKHFLNKTVKMRATFDKFSTLGLDYSKALRKSTDYIGILIQRDDVVDHDIPLSEMKLFMKKDMAQKHIDLDTGDKIEITAHMFSMALNDPWLDIENIEIIKKAKKEQE